MTKRLTDEEIADIRRRERPGCVELFPSELESLLDEVLEFRARKAQEERVSECSVCGYMDGNGGYYRRPNCKECGGMP